MPFWVAWGTRSGGLLARPYTGDELGTCLGEGSTDKGALLQALNRKWEQGVWHSQGSWSTLDAVKLWRHPKIVATPRRGMLREWELLTRWKGKCESQKSSPVAYRAPLISFRGRVYRAEWQLWDLIESQSPLEMFDVWGLSQGRSVMLKSRLWLTRKPWAPQTLDGDIWMKALKDIGSADLRVSSEIA